MNERIEKLARTALKTDTFPTPICEPLRSEEELKDPVAVAQGMRRYLLKQTVEVRPEELLADRYRYHGCEYPSDYYKSNGHRYKNAAWDRCCHVSHPNDVYYWGWTHVSLDYGYVLENGLQAYADRIDRACERYAGDAEKTQLLNGMRIALNAIQERCQLVADEAKKQAAVIDDAEVRENYLRIAEAMSHAPMKPARNFFETVQCTWSMFLVAPDSLGRIDQYLYPYYRREMDAGALTREHAKELLQELFVKVHESQVDNRPQPHSGHNHLVVGGYLQNGEDGFNDLSVLILECIAELPTFRPQASFRYTDKTTPETMSMITEFNHKCPLIVFVNDIPRIKGMVNAGIRREDAIEYTVLGCNEWAICGKSRLDLAHTNMMHSLKKALFDHRQELEECGTFDEVYSLFEKMLAEDINRIVADYEVYCGEQACDINVLTSALMDDCIEKARPFNADGTRYHGLSVTFNGITNVTDSLNVISDMVLDRKLFTMGELMEALDCNWAGYDDMHNMILRQGRFFGNDDAEADTMMQRIVDSV